MSVTAYAGSEAIGEDPWVNIKGRYPENTRVVAKVTNLTDYGCFAEIEEGVEGLIHVSEMDWTNKNIHPSKVVNLGDEIEVRSWTSTKSVVVFLWV